MIPNAVTKVPDSKIQDIVNGNDFSLEVLEVACVQLEILIAAVAPKNQDCGLPRRARIRCRGQGWEGADHAENLVEK